MQQKSNVQRAQAKARRKMVSRRKMVFSARSLSVFAALVAGGLIGRGTHAAVLTWDGGDATHNGAFGGSGTWDLNTAATWDNGIAEVDWTDSSGIGVDTAVFTDTAGAVTLNTNLSARGLQWFTSGYTLSGTGALTLGSGGIDASTVASGTTTVSNDVVLASAQSWNVGSGGTLAINGAVTRSAGVVLAINNDTSNGTGVYTSTSLTNANGVIGPWATYGSGTSMKYATVSGGVISGLTGTPAATGTNLTDTTGTVNYDLAARSGTVPATVSANTIRYTGAAGTLALGATSFTLNGLMNVGSGTLTVASNALTIGADQELVITGPSAISISSVIQDNGAGASALTYAGTSTLVLSGANTFTGPVNILAGTVTSFFGLLVPGATPLGMSSTTNVINLGDPTGVGNGDVTLSFRFGMSRNEYRGINVQGANTGTATIAGDAGGGNQRAQLLGTITLGTNGATPGTGLAHDLTFSTANTNPNAIVIMGNIVDPANLPGSSGVVTVNAVNNFIKFAGANTFTGGVNFTGTGPQGLFDISSASALGTGTFTINGGTINNDTTALTTLSTNNVQVWNGDFTFQGTKSLNMGTGAVSLGATAGTTRTVTVNANTLTIGGVISNGTNGLTSTTALTKAGAGTLLLTGANAYTGATTVQAGTLQTSGSLTTGNIGVSGGTLTGSGTIHFDLGATPDLISLTAGTLNASGLTIDFVGPASQSSYLLVDYSVGGAFSTAVNPLTDNTFFNATNTPLGYQFFNDMTTKQVFLQTVPEPGPFALLGLLSGLTMIKRRPRQITMSS
jgi:autotransporter-associated beta strand protein